MLLFGRLNTRSEKSTTPMKVKMRKEVPRLIVFAVGHVAEFLLSFICADETSKLKAASYAQKFLSNEAKQQILSAGIKIEGGNVRANAIFLLELLQPKHVENIDLMECESIYRCLLPRLATVIYNVCSGSTRSVCFRANRETCRNDNCHGCQSTSIFFTSIGKAIQNMPNLTKLVLQECATDELLILIGRGCHRLHHLDISHSTDLNDYSMKLLLFGQYNSKHDAKLFFKCDKLKRNPICNTLSYLGIRKIDISILGLALLFHELPKLASFGGFTMRSVPEAVLMLHKYVPERKLSLSHIWSNHNLSQEQLECLTSNCPSLVWAHVLCSSICQLDYSIPFKCLKVRSGDSNPSSVDLYLKHMGQNLIDLDIRCVTFLDICEIARNCPLLRSLKTALLSEGDITMPKLVHLEEAEVQLPNEGSLKVLFGIAPNLRKLRANFFSGGPSTIHPNYFLTNVLRPYHSTKLESLNLQYCNLNVTTLDEIICLFPNLTSIGTLRTWYSLRDIDIQLFLFQVKMSNRKLEIVVNEPQSLNYDYNWMCTLWINFQ